MKKAFAQRRLLVSQTPAIAGLPNDVLEFLKEILLEYSQGHRDEQFAYWAAVRASFILEFNGLLY